MSFTSVNGKSAKQSALGLQQLIETLPNTHYLRKAYDDVKGHVKLGQSATDAPELASSIRTKIMRVGKGDVNTGRDVQDVLRAAKVDLMDFKTALEGKRAELRPDVMQELEKVGTKMESIAKTFSSAVDAQAKIDATKPIAGVDLTSLIGGDKAFADQLGLLKTTPGASGGAPTTSIEAASVQKINFNNKDFDFTKTDRELKREIDKFEQEVEAWNSNRITLADELINTLTSKVENGIKLIETEQRALQSTSGAKPLGKMLESAISHAPEPRYPNMELPPSPVKGPNYLRGAGIGGALGAAGGYFMTEKPEDKGKNAVIFGGIGAGGGALVETFLGGAKTAASFVEKIPMEKLAGTALHSL